MFGGSGLGLHSPLTSLFLRNPEMAAAYRRQQYAEALGQAGMSGEPIRSPWQGVNKLAQAGIAAMLMNRSDEEMTAAAQKQRDQEAAQEAQGTEFMNRALGLINPQGGGSPMSQALLNPGGVPPQQPPQAQPQPQPQEPGQPTQIPDALLPHFQRASAETGVPIPVLAAVARQESGFRPNAVGDDGKSTGTMQVQARTARDPGFGVAPIDPAKLNDPGENIMFGARYLAGRAKAAGVTDWYDPAQRALALKAYNGGGDPNYVNHVERFIPGTGGQPAGDAGGDPSMPTPPIPPGTPQATGAPQGAGPQAAPTQQQYAAIEADIKAGRNLQALATAGGASTNPTIRKNAENMRVIGTQMENRAIAERNRLDTLANRNVQHTIAVGPDGKNYIYEVTPNGLGRQLGMAPKQPGEQTGPFAGNGMDQQAANVMLSLAPKIKDGTATNAEKATYGLAYNHYAQGDLKLVPDPSDPTGQRQMQARIPRDIPEQFPPPNGGAGQGGAGGTGPRVIPGTEKDTPMTTDQAKSAGYADRMQASNQIIGAKISAGTSRIERGAASVPLIGNSLVSADYQQLEQAQRDFINAKLRQESGAAIAESEFENARKQYFPQPGDGPEVIAQKARNRDLVIQGMAREAGKGYTVPKAATPDAPAIPPPPDGFKVVK